MVDTIPNHKRSIPISSDHIKVIPNILITPKGCNPSFLSIHHGSSPIQISSMLMPATSQPSSPISPTSTGPNSLDQTQTFHLYSKLSNPTHQGPLLARRLPTKQTAMQVEEHGIPMGMRTMALGRTANRRTKEGTTATTPKEGQDSLDKRSRRLCAHRQRIRPTLTSSIPVGS